MLIVALPLNESVKFFLILVINILNFQIFLMLRLLPLVTSQGDQSKSKFQKLKKMDQQNLTTSKNPSAVCVMHEKMDRQRTC